MTVKTAGQKEGAGLLERALRGARELSRETVTRTANILGPFSAAAMALEDAAKHDGPMRFWQARDGTLLLEKQDARKVVGSNG